MKKKFEYIEGHVYTPKFQSGLPTLLVLYKFPTCDVAGYDSLLVLEDGSVKFIRTPSGNSVRRHLA